MKSKEKPAKLSKKLEDKPYHKNINVAEAVILKLVNGNTNAMIAKKYGCSQPAVSKAIRRFLDKLNNPAILEAYQKSKTNFLDMGEAILFTDMLDPDKRKTASLNNVAYAFGTIHKANLLEQGRSTENISHYDVVKAAQEELRKLQEVEEAHD